MTPRSRLNSIFCNRLSRSATRWTSSFQDGMRFQLAITQGLDQLEDELRVVLFDFLRHAAHQNNTRAGTVPHSAGRYRGGRCRSVNPEGLGPAPGELVGVRREPFHPNGLAIGDSGLMGG